MTPDEPEGPAWLDFAVRQTILLTDTEVAGNVGVNPAAASFVIGVVCHYLRPLLCVFTITTQKENMFPESV